MPRPSFSEMLVTRRRQLGLSISQASQVLRLKEQVLIAFEEGDFDHIPKSGYAQGMLSSYARYLGLNPRQVVNQFQADLDDYVKTARTSGGFDDEADTYLAPRKLLPTSGGPAGDLGAFATTSQPHSRQQQSSPLVTRRYVGTLHDEPERAYGYDVDQAYYDTQVEQPKPYPARQSASSQRGRGTSSRGRRRNTERSSYARTDSYVRDDVTTRRVVNSPYADDPMYDEGGSAQTRRNSRQSGGSRNGGGQKRRQGAPQRNGGLVGAVLSFFSDRRRLLYLGGALVALLLIGALVFTVRSCSSSKQDEGDKTVPVSASATKQDTEKTDAAATGTGAAATDATATNATADGQTTAAQGTDATQDPNAAAGATAGSTGTTATTGTTTGTTTANAAPKETKVTVTVEAGMVSWVEILCDSESKVATTLTGPWSETYDVHDSITIEVGETTAVTVTENGKQRQFDSKSSGIGTITIQGTPEVKTTTPEGDATQKQDEDPDAQNEQTEDQTNEQEQSQAFNTEGDEYLYNYNGYDIYYNADNDLYYFFGDDGAMYNAADGTPL